MDSTSANHFKSELSTPRPCSEVELGRALATLGFGSWTALESSMMSIISNKNFGNLEL